MGIEDEKIDQIIEAHTETVNGLKDKAATLEHERDELKKKADLVPGLQEKVKTFEEENGKNVTRMRGGDPKGYAPIYAKEKCYPHARGWSYGGEISDWQHAKGRAIINTEDGDIPAEVHWSQCEGIGKVEFFIKKWLE